MAPSDLPPDQDNDNSSNVNGKNVIQEPNVAELIEEVAEPVYQSTIDEDEQVDNLQFDQIDGLDNNDLTADTLEFESINRRPKRKVFSIKIILVLFMFGVGGYFMWMQWGDVIFGFSGNSLPIVRAPEEPFKARPEKPGGLKFPNRDKLVYDRLERKPIEKKAENILPRPEIPLVLPRSKTLRNSELKIESEIQKVPPKTIGSQPSTAEVRAVEKPDMNSVSSSLRKKEKNRKSTINPNNRLSLPSKAKLSVTGGSGIKEKIAENYQIQLAAVRTAASANKEWFRLQSKNKDILGKLKSNVIRADLGNQGIFFRLRAGPIASRASAKALCPALARVKVGCLVIAPPR